MATEKVEYEIDEFAEKVRKALRKMEETAAPGERSGKGGRMDVLRAVKADIARLVEAGYTVQQITNAIASGDVFKILPKSITQLLNEGNRPAKAEPQSRTEPSNRKVSQKRTSGVRDTVTKNKPPTSDNDVLATAADVEEPNKPAPEVRQAPAGGRTGPRPDRD